MQKTVNMKKYTLALFIILLIAIATGCNRNKSTDVNPAEKKIVTTPSGRFATAVLTTYTYDTKIVTYHNDTMWVEAETDNPQVKLFFLIPGQGKDGILPVGTPMKVAAKEWSGGYETGWTYSIIK